MAIPKPQFQFNPSYIQFTPIFFKVNFGSSTATLATADYVSLGVSSFVRDSAGTYTLTLSQPFSAFLGASVVIGNASGIGGSPVLGIDTDDLDPPTGVIKMVLSDVETPAATDPADGDVGYFTVFVKQGIGA